MSELAIKIENISKQYRLGLIGTGTISHDLNRWWYRVRGKEDPYLKIGDINDRSVKSKSEYVWALKDITFDVKQGEVLGIIGKNGAGKSTLLKLLSRVTAPTTGTIKAKGRIASLLEVGTGFHPELTGKENIYMNGSILGMTKPEIKRKFDEIVDFAGVEKYIDTPVKRYSSGMTVRLGFAVAAHLEPEIMVVDEVLAVGDAEFQKKAIGKMQDVSQSDGRTILFVSHNMAAVKSLCTRGVILKDGQVKTSGNIESVIDVYLRENKKNSNFKYIAQNTKPHGFFKKLALCSDFIEVDSIVNISEEVWVDVEYVIEEDVRNYNTGFILQDALGTHIYSSADTDLMSELILDKKAGLYKVKVPLPLYNLNTGLYKIIFLMGIINYQVFDKVELSFLVENDNYINTGNRQGLLLSLNKWEYY